MSSRSTSWWPVKTLLFLLLNSFNMFIAAVGISYLHPDFQRGYLAGKAQLFENSWFPYGLLLHAFSSPAALLIVSALVLFPLERYPVIHRPLGKVALLFLLLAVVPSGWLLSYYAMGGIAGKLIFFVLAGYTGYTAVQGYLHIRRKNLTAHRFYMLQTMVLLSSAVLLRLLLVFFSKVIDIHGDTPYAIAAALSWLPGILLIHLLVSKGNID